jgi:hypothetical protein
MAHQYWHFGSLASDWLWPPEQRQRYEREYAVAKEEYDRELREWRLRHPEEVPKPAPRPANRGPRQGAAPQATGELAGPEPDAPARAAVVGYGDVKMQFYILLHYYHLSFVIQ